MYIAMAVFALVFVLITIIRTVSNRNYILIYTAYGNEGYFKIIAKLKEEGIKYKTVTPYRAFDTRIDCFIDNSQYDIYVKKEVEHIAVKALHKGN